MIDTCLPSTGRYNGLKKLFRHFIKFDLFFANIGLIFINCNINAI